MELRVLIHAPRGRDAAVVKDVLQGRHQAHACNTPAQLMAALEHGAGAAVITEEALADQALVETLQEWLAAQPPWSDFPFVVLASRQTAARPQGAVQKLRILGNVILLERPLNSDTLLSAADAAVRARQRQYVTRQHLDEINRGQSEVQKLNADLERRIEGRTMELANANNRLMKEISERERAQAQLTQSQKMEAIGRLTGGIAHDFNNLLHVVNMNLELISIYAKEEKTKPVVERAKAAAKRGSKLTNQLLSFARNQSLHPRLTHVNKLLLGMRDLIEISAGSAVQVEFEFCEPDCAVTLDPSQLEMAVLNLAVNSRDAMPEGGSLKISTCRKNASDAEGQLQLDDYAVLSVTDSGPGIPQQLLSKVFDPFFTTKPIGSGTGLGLSQVYGFARQSGGVAFIRSEVGKGTTVEMYFPCSAEDEEDSTDSGIAAPMPRGEKSRRILVVEDDHDVRRVIVECLGIIGYSVSEAANGSEGLEAIRREKPDLLVIDFAMPDMTGAEVISKAREMVGELPVILATGYADMAAVERLAGRPMVLRKPFDINSLGSAVASVLRAADEKALSAA